MISLLLSYLLIYRYVAIFLVVFSAGVIIPWPVNTIILAVGAFSSQGYFNFWIALGVSLVANVMGDFLDYWITLKYGKDPINNFYVKRMSYFVRLEKYIRTHAGLTIMITRFVGVLDIVGNFISGLIGIPIKTFLFYDTLGNFIFFVSILSFGYVVGNYWQNFTNSLTILSEIILVVILISVIFKIFYNSKKNNF